MDISQWVLKNPEPINALFGFKNLVEDQVIKNR